jgi:hypothetical protein
MNRINVLLLSAVTFIVISSCSLIAPTTKQRLPAANVQDVSCINILSSFAGRSRAQHLETFYKKNLPYYKREMSEELLQISKYGQWKFRSKNRGSIQAKMIKKYKAGKPIQKLKDVRRLISDGLGARLVLDDTGPEAIQGLVDSLERGIKSGEVVLERLKNYRLASGNAYLSDTQVDTLRKAVNNTGKTLNVLEGDDAVKSSGYISLHLKIITDDGVASELQVRGELIDQLSEVVHVFYDYKSGKNLSPMYKDNKQVKKVLNRMKSLSKEEEESFSSYIIELFEYYRKVELDLTSVKSPPKLPTKIQHLKELDVKYIWDAIDEHFTENYATRTLDQPTKISKVVDAAKIVLNNSSLKESESIIGNILQGKNTRYPLKEIEKQVKEKLEEVKDLDHFGVIPWEEGKYLKQRRKDLRKGRTEGYDINRPRYMEGQELGPANLHISKVHYMQGNADNQSGKYTVVGNAKALRAGTLKTSDLPPLQVWKDHTGKVWSLDHRRLAAYQLADVVEYVPVVFVERAAVVNDNFKFSTFTDGKSMLIEFGDSPLSIIVGKDYIKDE